MIASDVYRDLRWSLQPLLHACANAGANRSRRAVPLHSDAGYRSPIGMAGNAFRLREGNDSNSGRSAYPSLAGQ
jgi:hypothetical protein